VLNLFFVFRLGTWTYRRCVLLVSF
jgi:hypothetical protein